MINMALIIDKFKQVSNKMGPRTLYLFLAINALLLICLSFAVVRTVHKYQNVPYLEGSTTQEPKNIDTNTSIPTQVNTESPQKSQGSNSNEAAKATQKIIDRNNAELAKLNLCISLRRANYPVYQSTWDSLYAELQASTSKNREDNLNGLINLNRRTELDNAAQALFDNGIAAAYSKYTQIMTNGGCET